MLDWLFSDPPAVGTEAPDFTLPDQDGNLVALASLRGKNVVLSVLEPFSRRDLADRQAE